MSSSPMIPVLCPRGSVLFPGEVVRLELRDTPSLAALALLGTSRETDPGLRGPSGTSTTESQVCVAVPLDPELTPGPSNLSPVGTIARVRSQLRLPGGGVRVTLQGLERRSLGHVERHQEVLLTRAESLTARNGSTAPTDSSAGPEEARLLQRTAELARLLAERGSRRLRATYAASDLPALLELNPVGADALVDFAAPLFDFSFAEQAQLLTLLDPLERLRCLHELVENDLLESDQTRDVDERVRERKRRRFLREQLEAIREELGDEDPREVEAREILARAAEAKLPEAVRERIERELVHLRTASRRSSEAGQIRSWIEWLFELPWHSTTARPYADPAQFERVRASLDEAHAGLAEVKERVIEYLAVRQLRRSAHGTALCFLGPPGTGKSSMARAVAQALGRRFVNIPIGGIAEEAELRGYSHRQEGGGPGLILEGIHRAGSSDPVVLLDEIDEIEVGSAGTFGGALLDILDPEQSHEFQDDYLGLPYDLSGCIFLATANDLSELPDTLVDRLEVIEFYGYTEDEKLAIAREHLLPAIRDNTGLTSAQFRISPAALKAVVRHYTEEAGVRQLGRVLSSLARKAAVSVIREGEGLYARKDELLELVGPTVADEDLQLKRPTVGVAAGLAWTSVGGALLPIEALAMPGAGRTQLTGHIGDVMRESVLTAISFVRTLFGELGIAHDQLEKLDIHVHFPSAAVPKDGPSAGVPIALAILSLLTRTPVRHDIAMTGEVSLRGQVLPVGGIREKLVAALRAGIYEVVVPARNEEEVMRLPEEIRANLTIHLIEHVRDAFGLVLARGRRRGPAALTMARRSRAARRATE